jgi:hypothetical protein
MAESKADPRGEALSCPSASLDVSRIGSEKLSCQLFRVLYIQANQLYCTLQLLTPTPTTPSC